MTANLSRDIRIGVTMVSLQNISIYLNTHIVLRNIAPGHYAKLQLKYNFECLQAYVEFARVQGPVWLERCAPQFIRHLLDIAAVPGRYGTAAGTGSLATGGAG